MKRREFLELSRNSIAAAMAAAPMGSIAAAEPPPETEKIRLIFDPDIPILCYAPQYVSEALLRAEGFTDIEYVPMIEASEALTLDSGKADLGATFTGDMINAIDRNNRISIISGAHPGCLELFASKQVTSVRELKGKRIAVLGIGSPDYIYLAVLLAHIGLDPATDIEWVVSRPGDWEELLLAGEVDAIQGYPPMSYGLRDRGVGNVIISTTTDKPWRQYFCCMWAANKSFVENYPVAAKRALRAVLKASDMCVMQPQQSAQYLVDNGFTSNLEYARRTFEDLSYMAWRDYNPEDTVRFYSLRMREAGLIEKTPQQIISDGTDFRIQDQLRLQLKG